MDERKKQLLTLIIETYMKTAEPVGSKFLVSLGKLDVSDATVRNEMRELEEAGYLTHPHTSAGRVPTEAGYRYYIETMMTPNDPDARVKESIDDIVKSDDAEQKKMKRVGQMVADYADAAVIIAIGNDVVYYTGTAKLFSQPEFFDRVHTVSISDMLDHCEEYIVELFQKTEPEKTRILVGKENPLGPACTLLVRQSQNEVLITILGPMRMNYERNIGILNYLSRIL